MRAEVGVLTRIEVVKCDDESRGDKFGAHIMLHSPPDGTRSTTTGRISYIKCFMCSQAFELGRHPLHFHMMGHAHSSYKKELQCTRATTVQ